MSNHHHSKSLLKMNTYLHDVFTLFENVLHPAAGKPIAAKQKKRSTNSSIIPKATPDSLNIRDILKRQDSFRRDPAP
jgi:hypothetical protein